MSVLLADEINTPCSTIPVSVPRLISRHAIPAENERDPNKGKYSFEFSRSPSDIKILPEPKSYALESIITSQDLAEINQLLCGSLPDQKHILAACGRTIYFRTSDGHHIRLNGGFWIPFTELEDNWAKGSRTILEPTGENFAATNPSVVTTSYVHEGQVKSLTKEYVPNGGFTLSQAEMKFSRTIDALHDNRLYPTVCIPVPLFVYEFKPGIYGIAFLEEGSARTHVARYDFALQSHFNFIRNTDPERSLPMVMEALDADLGGFAEILRYIHSFDGLARYHRQFTLGNIGKSGPQYFVADWDTALLIPWEQEDNFLARAIDLRIHLMSAEHVSTILPAALGYQGEQYYEASLGLLKHFAGTILTRYESSGYRISPTIAARVIECRTTVELAELLKSLNSVREEVSRSCI